MEPTRYTLTVFEPGSSRSQACSYESSTPFAAISVGDAVHPAGPKRDRRAIRKLLKCTTTLGRARGRCATT
jgi:hypothetical protein